MKLQIYKLKREWVSILAKKIIGILKSLLIYFTWVIAFTILAGLILFFYLPSNSNLENVLVITLFLCLPLIIIVLFGLIKGKINFLRIPNRGSLLFRSAILISCLASFFLLGVGQSAMAQVLLNENSQDRITNSEKIEFIKDLARKISTNKVSSEYINSLDRLSPNDRLTVYYSTEDKELAEKLVKVIPEIEQRLNKMFDVKEPFPIELILYNDLDQFRKSNDIAENQRLLGLYINKGIHMANTKVSEEIYQTSSLDLDLQDLNYEEEIIHTLEHEYTHYYIRGFLAENNLKEDIPRWFDEGLAVYYGSEGYLTDVEFEFPDLKDSSIPLQDLMGYIEWEKKTKSETASDIAYNESFMMVYELIKTKGEKVITDILLKGIPKAQDLSTNEQTQFTESFLEQVGMTMDDFQNQVLTKYSISK